MWVLDLRTNNLYNDDAPNYHSALLEPFPKILWYVDNESSLNILSIPQLYHTPALETPFPKLLWFVGVTGDSIESLSVPTEYGTALIKPFPKILWFVEDLSCLTYALPTYEPLGALRHAINLAEIIIPKSVLTIGDYSMEQTMLSSVTINPDCVWDNEHSFPETCKVTFYTT